MKIDQEIQQETFANSYQKAHINLLFSASWLSLQNTNALKPLKLSWQQFNVLRILRGKYPKSSTVKMITEKMIDKTSNASRLVDKLALKELVERKTCESDRRQVDIFITTKGLDLVEQASNIIENTVQNKMRENLTEQETEQLNYLLDKMRG